MTERYKYIQLLSTVCYFVSNKQQQQQIFIYCSIDHPIHVFLINSDEDSSSGQMQVINLNEIIEIKYQKTSNCFQS